MKNSSNREIENRAKNTSENHKMKYVAAIGDDLTKKHGCIDANQEL
jgi:hypothetical protein